MSNTRQAIVVFLVAAGLLALFFVPLAGFLTIWGAGLVAAYPVAVDFVSDVRGWWRKRRGQGRP